MAVADSRPTRHLTAAGRLELAREAGGNPFLLQQLAHYAAGDEARGSRDATLADMLQHRLHGSPDGARRFLDVLAVCGRPMPPDVVYEAAGLAGDERPLVALLHSDHLLRHSGSASRIEMYHDRLRETLAAQLSPEDTRDIHDLLVRTLTARGADDPERSSSTARAPAIATARRAQAARAATKAHAVLAFDRAAFFYRSALELVPDAPAAAEWKQGLAEALTHAGRPPEAAHVYLEASTGADGWRQVDLQRRAAEQFLIGGHIDQGMDVIRDGPARPAHAAGAELRWWRSPHWYGGARGSAGADSRSSPATRITFRRTRLLRDRYLLVRHHRSRDGRQHSCGGFQHPSSAAGARGRRPVPHRARPGTRGHVRGQWRRRRAMPPSARSEPPAWRENRVTRTPRRCRRSPPACRRS